MKIKAESEQLKPLQGEVAKMAEEMEGFSETVSQCEPKMQGLRHSVTVPRNNLTHRKEPRMTAGSSFPIQSHSLKACLPKSKRTRRL